MACYNETSATGGECLSLKRDVAISRTIRKDVVARKAQPKAAKPSGDLSARILEAALDLAVETGWSRLRLGAVADHLGISLADILDHYRDKDAVANALFHRAWRAMLATPPDSLAGLAMVERLHLLLMRWFDALAPHRAVASQMLSDKIYLSHLHHWVPMVFNLSRTIHWLLDAAGDESQGRRRQLIEIGMTGIFLATLRVWTRDDSDGQSRTRDFLKARLEAGDRWLGRRYRRGTGRQSGGASSKPSN